MEWAIRLFETEETKDMSGVSDACGNLGNLLVDTANALKGNDRDYADMGTDLKRYRDLYCQTEKLYTKALQNSRILDEHSPDRGIGQDYGNLAIVHTEFARLAEFEGDVRKAANFYEQAQSEFVKRNTSADRDDVKDHRGRANGLGNLGNLHLSRKDYEKAIECQNKALILQRQVGNKRGEAATLGNLAIIYYRLGSPDDIQKADCFTEVSVKLFDEIVDVTSSEKSKANQIQGRKSCEFKPIFHLADRYGKITDAEIGDFRGVDISAIEKSCNYSKWWHEQRKRHVRPRSVKVASWVS